MITKRKVKNNLKHKYQIVKVRYLYQKQNARIVHQTRMWYNIQRYVLTKFKVKRIK